MYLCLILLTKSILSVLDVRLTSIGICWLSATDKLSGFDGPSDWSIVDTMSRTLSVTVLVTGATLSALFLSVTMFVTGSSLFLSALSSIVWAVLPPFFHSHGP